MTPADLVQDLVHMPTQEAERLAREAGFCVRVEQTAPPRGPIEGCARVVRAVMKQDTLVLTSTFYPAAQE